MSVRLGCAVFWKQVSPWTALTLHLPLVLFHVHLKADISDKCSPLSSHGSGQKTSKVGSKEKNNCSSGSYSSISQMGTETGHTVPAYASHRASSSSPLGSAWSGRVECS